MKSILSFVFVFKGCLVFIHLLSWKKSICQFHNRNVFHTASYCYTSELQPQISWCCRSGCSLKASNWAAGEGGRLLPSLPIKSLIRSPSVAHSEPRTRRLSWNLLICLWFGLQIYFHAGQHESLQSRPLKCLSGSLNNLRSNGWNYMNTTPGNMDFVNRESFRNKEQLEYQV